MSCRSVSQSSSKTVLNCLWNTGGVCANFIFACGAFTDGRYRPGRAQWGFVEALCRKLFMSFFENQRVNVGWWAKKWSLPGFFFLASYSSPLPRCLYIRTRFCGWEVRATLQCLWRACVQSEMLATWKNVSFPWFPLISPCLLTSSDLWSACTSSLEKAKDLKLAVLDVAGWRCRKKKIK